MGRTALLEQLQANMNIVVDPNQDRIRMVHLIDDNKTQILDNLINEQNFKIGLNSVDPQIDTMQGLFGQMKLKWKDQI